jgi:hypothetical protein
MRLFQQSVLRYQGLGNIPEAITKELVLELPSLHSNSLGHSGDGEGPPSSPREEENSGEASSYPLSPCGSQRAPLALLTLMVEKRAY